MLRNYLYEYVLIGLSVAIVFLTYELLDLNTFIRNKLMNELSTSSEALHQSTETIKNFNDHK